MQTTAVSPEQLSDELGRLIRHMVQLQQGDAFGGARDTELTFSQVRALCVLEHADEELALTALAPRLGLSPAATGRALDALADRGLVDRRPDPLDRRVKRLALTDAGHETAQRVLSAKRDAVLRFAQSLGDGEREELSRALAPVLARVEASS
jgi:DNA-binding MarR family transcriptional regulator